MITDEQIHMLAQKANITERAIYAMSSLVLSLDDIVKTIQELQKKKIAESQAPKKQE